MGTRTPKLFRSPLPEKKYRKRIEARIFLENDRRFLREITTVSEDGKITLSRELTDAEAKRLGTLVKQAKKNRGAVRRGKLAILLAIAASVLAFNLLFRNMIAERTAEQLLERVFEAESEITGMNFRPLAGTIAFDSLVVADRASPMTNLFELSNGRLGVDLWQAFQGSIVINDLTVSGLAFSTSREQSGALPERGTRTAPSIRPPAERFSLDTLGLPETLDPQLFLEQNLELLRTPERTEAFVEQSERFVSQSRDTIAQSREQTIETFEELSQFARTDFTAVENPQRALELYNRSTSLLAETDEAVRNVQTQISELQSQTAALLAEGQALPAVVSEDFERLVDLIPDMRVDGPQFLRGLVEPVVRDALGNWYGRIATGYEYFQRVQALREGREPRGFQRNSTVVHYETTRYPVFLLEQAFFSSTGATELEATLQQVSSDQSINNSPTLLDYQMVRDGSTTSIGALLDLREEADVNLALTLSADSVPVVITEGIGAIGFERFTGEASIDVAYQSGSRTEGTALIEVAEPAFSSSAELSQIGRFVDEVVRQSGTVVIRVSYTIDEQGVLSLAGTSTNLDQAFAGAIQQQIDATIAEFQRELDAALQSLLEGDLQSVSAQLDRVVAIEQSAEQLLQQAAESRELAQSVVRRAEEAVASLRQEAEQQVQDAVEDEVERIRERLPLPGF
jgi:uncharacterized protein (TIGR03545 family)